MYVRKLIGLIPGILILLCYCGPRLGTVEPKDSIFADTMVDLTWPEIKKAADDHAIIILPIAVVEEHGPQMDLSPDIYQTCLGCRYIKNILEAELETKAVEILRINSEIGARIIMVHCILHLLGTAPGTIQVAGMNSRDIRKEEVLYDLGRQAKTHE